MKMGDGTPVLRSGTRKCLDTSRYDPYSVILERKSEASTLDESFVIEIPLTIVQSTDEQVRRSRF